MEYWLRYCKHGNGFLIWVFSRVNRKSIIIHYSNVEKIGKRKNFKSFRYYGLERITEKRLERYRYDGVKF